MKSLRGENPVRGLSPYGAVNYLLFRAYEAAKQLQRTNATGRVALVVIDELTWFTFETQLKDGWIDWKNPAFIGVNDSFIDNERNENPSLDAELGPVLRSIDSVWILERSDGRQFTRRF